MKKFKILALSAVLAAGVFAAGAGHANAATTAAAAPTAVHHPINGHVIAKAKMVHHVMKKVAAKKTAAKMGPMKAVAGAQHAG